VCTVYSKPVICNRDSCLDALAPSMLKSATVKRACPPSPFSHATFACAPEFEHLMTSPKSIRATIQTILRTCFAYPSYVLLVLWMLFKECLGYEVDWSRGPPLTPPQWEELEALESQQLFRGGTTPICSAKNIPSTRNYRFKCGVGIGGEEFLNDVVGNCPPKMFSPVLFIMDITTISLQSYLCGIMNLCSKIELKFPYLQERMVTLRLQTTSEELDSRNGYQYLKHL